MGRSTRRDFLKYGATAGLLSGAAGHLTGCGSLFSPDAPNSVLPPGDLATDQPARVAVVRGVDLDSMAREALEAFGGAGSIVQPGETVFIKPNLCGAGMVNHPLFSTGECTKPEIIIAVADECLKAGAAEVIIGDAGQVTSFSWETMFTLDGSTNLAAAAERLSAAHPGRVRLACLNSDSPAWDPLPAEFSGLGEIYVSSLVARADRIISLPVIKTHRWTQVTGALKNFMGVTSGQRYGIPGMSWRIKLHDAPGGLDQTFLDIVAGLRPDFTLVDGSICCEGNGPHVMPGWWGTTVDMRDRLGDWFVLASTDLVAADATAARIINHKATEIPHLAKAYARGLGQLQSDLIELDGARLEDLRVDLQPADLTSGFLEVMLPGLIMMME